ncbi:Major facilitator superfamily transporter [Rasamsonia emersonii CBS 393.64]|uniref:Major facilitator superfamily transporter n=1 Tax=Rasamsonia emersonii (strain ATCC 16479 / CBS 393.64 / IMI 116815) TaxID=1408163 RepID=A0A0F4Z078_RASE3|nr:Major facilitator superfamily transporter [Rasamsonia emersonii CBS 393.64]KKA23750.1 Major facilitator superfamily transporter [Rasamsonia emersonii CBS 393.64]
MGSLADTVGRRPVYMVAFSIYILANVGLAIQRSFPALLTLRMLQSARSSGTTSLGYGVISDIASPAERGFYVGMLLLGPNVAPPIGPLLGGAIADRLGWSYIFWFLCGLSGLCLLTITLSLPETARCIDGNGSISARGIIYKQWLPILRHVAVRNPAEVPQERRQPLRRLPNSIRSLRILLEKDSAIILFCNGIFYATYCCLQASLSSLFIALYDYGELQAGLVYIPFGVGCLIASLLLGKLLDHDYARVAKAQNARAGNTRPNELENFPIEKARLRSIFYPVSVSVLVIIGYGWALEKRVSLGTLLTDIHPTTSSTAAAAANIVRCPLAAGGTSVLQLLIESVGVGWCFTLIGAVCGLCIPLLVFERERGGKWRMARAINTDRTGLE